MGNEGFASKAEWPEFDEELVDEDAEFTEDYVESIKDDITQILDVTDTGKPEKIALYVAGGWKREAYRMALEKVREGRVELGELIGEGKEELSDVPPGEIAEFFKSAVKELRKMPEERAETLSEKEMDEFKMLEDATDFFKEQFNAEEVEVYMSEDEDIYDPQDRASQAVPFKPAIFVE